MFLSKYTKKFLLISTLLSICLLAGCGSNTGVEQSEVKSDVQNESADDTGSETSDDTKSSAESATDNETNSTKTTTEAYVAQNETYALALPNGEAFGEILQDFVYWEYATAIENDKSNTIIGMLYDKNTPEKEYKINLYYQELDIERMDQVESGMYNVIVTFPEEKDLSYFSFYYNARGFDSDYDYGYDGGWISEEDDLDEISSQELEENPSFRKYYTLFGEVSLTISKKKAKSYEVTNKFADGEKEAILAAIQKEVKKTYKKEKNLYVYIRDFLPGDTRLEGRVVNLDIEDRFDIPLFWVQSLINYSGAKMEKFNGVYWDTHYSTAYSGAGGPYAPSLKQVKKWAKEELDEVDAENCILAYHIKDGKLIDLKSRDQ